MFGSLGVWEVLLILVVLLLAFGAKRLPEIGSALGKGIREFKSSVKEIEGEISRETRSERRDLTAGRQDTTPATPPPGETAAKDAASSEPPPPPAG